MSMFSASTECPPVCAIFCPFGNILDENNCPTCECKTGTILHIWYLKRHVMIQNKLYGVALMHNDNMAAKERTYRYFYIAHNMCNLDLKHNWGIFSKCSIFQN